MTTAPLLIRHAELDGELVSITVRNGTIGSIHPPDEAPGGLTVLDAEGGAVVPGLHDHHIHLLSLAARRASVSVDTAAVSTPDDFDRVVATAARTAADWLRIVGHEDERCGPIDADRLDALTPSVPIRVQHHSGACWTLNSVGLTAIGVDRDRNADRELPDGVERGRGGRPTGRLWRLDDWLRARLPAAPAPDLAPVGRLLAAWGVTGVTDATATDDQSYFDVIAAAQRQGTLPLRVTVMGGPGLAGHAVPAPLRAGAVKLIVADHDLPDPDALTAQIVDAHARSRPVAIHCVTRTAVALGVLALSNAGTRSGDRIEHGSVLDPATVQRLAELGVTVVTQPAFVTDRGDHYRAALDRGEHDDLYRIGSLIDAGIPVGGSSDAPHGDPNPWRGIAAAVRRRTRAGHPLGSAEAVAARRALALYLSPAATPGGPPRTVTPGAPADLCVLDRPLDEALLDPEGVAVLATLRAGAVTHGDPPRTARRATGRATRRSR